MCKGPSRIKSGQGSRLIASHVSSKTKSLNWEQTGGVQRRSDLAALQAEASKATFWRTIFERLRRDYPILSHVEYCAALATGANVACGRAIAMRLRTGKASRAPLEPQVVQDNWNLGYNRHQQELVNLWWKPWNEQQFTSMMAYTHLEETKRHLDSEAEPHAVNQGLRKTSGEEDQNIETSVQQLVPLGSTDKVELQAKEVKKWSNHVNYMSRQGMEKSESADYDCGPSGAFCPGRSSDADKLNGEAADVSTRTSLRFWRCP